MSMTDSPLGILDYLGVDEDKFSWHDLALCRGDNDSGAEQVQERGNLYYETYEADPISAVAVDQVCFSCPVRGDCGSFGQETRQWGVWGGVYWDGTGKPDLDRNAHKTWDEWLTIMKYVYIPDKSVEEIKRRLNV